MSSTSSAINVVNDMHSLEGNLAQLGVAIGNFNNGADGADVALFTATQNTAVSALAALSDIAQAGADTPLGSVLSKVTGIAGLITGWQSVVNDLTAIQGFKDNNQPVPNSAYISLIGDLIQVAAPTAQVTVESLIAMGLLPELAGAAAVTSTAAGVTSALVGSAISAYGALLGAQPASPTTIPPSFLSGPTSVLGTSISFANGDKGTWFNSGQEDANGTPVATFETWDSNGNIVSSITVPVALESTPNPNGFTIVGPSGDTAQINADGTTTLTIGGVAQPSLPPGQTVIMGQSSIAVAPLAGGAVTSYATSTDPDPGSVFTDNGQTSSTNTITGTSLDLSGAPQTETETITTTTNSNGSQVQVTITDPTGGVIAQANTTYDASGTLISSQATVGSQTYSSTSSQIGLSIGQFGVNVDQPTNQAQLSASGVLTEDYQYAASGQETGVALDASGLTLNADPDTTITVNAPNDTINLASGTSATVQNSSGASSTNINLSSTSQLTLDSGSGYQVSATAGATVATTGDTSFSLTGGGIIANLQAGDNLTVSNTNGQADTVNASGLAGGAGINFGGEGEANVYGDGNAINVTGIAGGGADSLGAYGGGDTITDTNLGAIFVSGTDGDFDTLNISGASRLTLDTNTQANINGSNDGVSLNSGDTAAVYGGGNAIILGADQQLAIGSTSGTFDTVTVNGDAWGDTTANGQGSGIWVGANSQVNVNGSDNGVSLNSGDVAGVYGGGNAVDMGAGEIVYLGDTNNDFDTVNANGVAGGAVSSDGYGTGISLDDDTQANINGSSDALFLNTGDAAGLYGGGNDVAMGADQLLVVGNTNNTFDTITVNGDQDGGTVSDGQQTGIILNPDAQANIYGSNNGVTLNSGDAAGVYGGGDSILLGADQLLVVGNTNNTFDTITVNGDQDGGTVSDGQQTGIILNPDAQANIYGSNNGVTLNSGDAAGVYGGGDSILLGADQLLVVGNTNNTFDTITGNGDQDGGTVSDGQQTGIILNPDAQANIYGSNNGVTLNSGDAAGVYGGGDSILLGADQLLVVGNTNNTFDTITVNGDQDGGTVSDGQQTGIILNPDAQANINGADNGVTLNSGSVAGVYGGDNTINAGSDDFLVVGGTNGGFDTINVSNLGSGGSSSDGYGTGLILDAGAQANINGSNDTINLNGSADSTITGVDNTIYTSSGDDITVDNSIFAYDENIDTINVTAGVTVHVDDSSAIAGAGDQVDIDGSGSTDYVSDHGDVTITGSDETVYVGSDTNVYVIGSDDTIDGGAGDVFAISGQYDPVDADDSGISYFDDNAGDTVTGNGDSGSDWGAGSDGDDGDGGDSGDGTYGGYGEYAFAAKKGPASSSIGAIAAFDAANGDQAGALTAQAARLQAEAATAETTSAGLASAAFEGPRWSTKTITWSLDVATGSGTPFTGTIGTQYEAAIQQAFATWAKASGLNFDEVSSGSSAAIKLGWDSFDTADTGVLGYTALKTQAGQIDGAAIMLEDPSQDALATDANGQPAYTGTGAELEQLVLHEIGHALGLADSSDPASIMAPTLSSANLTLDSTDTDAIQALYGSSSASLTAATSAYWSNLDSQSAQLIDAIAGFTSSDASALTGVIPPPTVILNPIQLAAVH